ncbi:MULTISPECIES: NAD(P)H-dependent oxidoreductase [Helicobacter]|uniref:NAD(P)H-dependent oxidoreductase n=1 Tax=Helicobacter TaxID=209 RepID=UPI000EB43AC5|nr:MULTISPECIES: NAD(P)H-dependent oxidoreductase [Helicobacter]
MPTLVVLAHPDLAHSRVNKALKEAIANTEVEISDLYALYPDFNIDVQAEQAKLLKAQKVVLQFPMFWYSSPPLLKKYFDNVLTYGFAYGSKGEALAGKAFALAISLGAREEDLSGEFSLERILTPFKATAHFVQMRYSKPFVIYNTARLDGVDLQVQAQAYQAWLKGLAH